MPIFYYDNPWYGITKQILPINENEECAICGKVEHFLSKFNKNSQQNEECWEHYKQRIKNLQVFE